MGDTFVTGQVDFSDRVGAKIDSVLTVGSVRPDGKALAIFIWNGHIDWRFGAALALGSIVGGVLGARLATSAHARKWIFRLLVVVILGELVHLAVHYVGQTA